MIVVFGSINVDLVFRVDSLPRPGETILTQACMICPGGKGANTAVAAARAGGRTRMVGRVGHDAFADAALHIMRSVGVDLEGVARSDRPTGCAAVCVDRHGENAIVVASGANLNVSASQVSDALLTDGTIVALQMEVAPAENWAVVKRARTSGAKIILNLAPAHPVPEQILADIDILIANRNEAALLASSLDLESDEPSDMARMLADRHAMTCIITLGREGAIAWQVDRGWQIPALPIDAVDTTGAGDAFCGGLAAALDRGLDIEAALRYASVSAGLVCGVEGAQSSGSMPNEIKGRLADLPDVRRIP